MSLERCLFHFRWPGFLVVALMVPGWWPVLLIAPWLVVCARWPLRGRVALAIEAAMVVGILHIGAPTSQFAVAVVFVLTACHLACVGPVALCWGLPGLALLTQVDGLRAHEFLLAGYVVALALVAYQRHSSLWRDVSAYLPSGLRTRLRHGFGSDLRRIEGTFVFADIEGFTALCNELSEDALKALITAYVDRLASAAEAHGGDVSKFVGDGALVCFGSAGAVARALAFCEQLAASVALPVRFGIATGTCLQGDWGTGRRRDHSVIGAPVNLAARLQASADTGRPLMCAESAAALEMELQPCRVELPGFGSTQAFRVRA